MPAKFISLFCLTCFFSIAYSQQKGYYRTPCLYKNTVVFTAEGDLWKYDLLTGTAARLTTDAGVEINPAISPDGKQIAFSGQYEGVPELYLMNINGGVPKRLTYNFDGRRLFISGWTKDGKILYRTSVNSTLPNTQLIKLDPSNNQKEVVPLWQASLGCYDDAGMLYFTRFINQGSKTKRYKGGYIEQVWKFDGRHEATNLTGDFDGASTSPMFYNGRIYFLSDRDGTMNLWSMDLFGKDLKQHTFSKGWDLQTPSIFEFNIVYQKGADIWLYDIKANSEKLLDISLISDFDQRKTKWIKGAKDKITFSDISPNGNYVAIISRGRVFVSPAKSDRWVETSRKSGVRAKAVHFINDKSIAVLSDQGGEYEVWKVNADGSGPSVQITQKSNTIITQFEVSPNGKFIAYDDKNEVLRIADVATGEEKFKYEGTYGGINEISWSANSLFLNVTESIENTNTQISVVDTRSMKMIPVTTPRLNSYSPFWSADSKWLYFASERNIVSTVKSPWGSRQPEPYYTKTANIFAVPLDSTAKFPFSPTDSWLTDSVFTAIPKIETGKTAGDKKSRPQPKPEKIYDWEKARNTLYEVPLKSANIGNVALANGYLYWLEYGTEDEPGGKLFALKTAESKKYEPVEAASNVAYFSVSANDKKLMIGFNDKTIAVADANGQKVDLDKSKVELNSWNFAIDPVQDWKELFNDAWRMMRDYFYDRDLHQVDWLGVKKRYEPLVERLTDRNEFDDLVGQMVGELSALHTFVRPGDARQPDVSIAAGFLGAAISKNPKGFKIDHIYNGDPDYRILSPLSQPDLHIKEGDIITEVNNFPVTDAQDIEELLTNKVNIPVKLTLTDKNNAAFEQVVRPISAQDANVLRYNEWEYKTRLKVDTLGNNEIGYIHLKAMGAGDMDDFVKQFYPIFNRKGLILDVRNNNGGNIDSWILEKLLRKAWMYWQARAGGPTWNMQYAFRGHMVLLCNQQTASDGEAISEGFRRLGFGKIIGMRSWGGEIWLSSDNILVDNGIASAAELGVYGPEGKWLIEGRGVEPDIEVDNLPYETYRGKDAQLEAAIAYLKKQIAEQPVDVPKAPKHPDKSFKY